MKKLVSVIIAIILISLVSCGKTEEEKTIDKFINAIKNFNYSEAIAVYNDAIIGNAESEVTAYTELLKILQAIIADYNNGDKNWIETSNLISTIEKVDDVTKVTYNSIIVYKEELSDLANSKAAFMSAEELYSDNMFLSAYNYYSLVIKEDIQYENAQTKMEIAINEHISELLVEIDSLVSDLNYKNALELIKETTDLVGVREQLQTKKQIIESQYTNHILNEAQQIFDNSKDYVTASNVLKGAANIVTDTMELSRLNASITHYEQYSPESPIDIPFHTISNVEYSFKHPTRKDNFGDEHENVISGTLTKDIFLDGKYERLTGTIFKAWDYRQYSEVRERFGYYSSSIDVYCDDVLVYQTTVHMQERPVPFSIDLRNVKVLKIRIYTVRKGTGWGLGDTYDFGGISNFYLYKKWLG